MVIPASKTVRRVFKEVFPPQRPTSQETMQRFIIRRFFEEVYSKGDLAVAHEILTTDFAFDGPPGGRHGPEHFLQCTSPLRTALGIHFAIEVVIADGDTVSCFSTMYGTHQGEFRGIPASGKHIAMPRIDTFHFSGSRIQEARTTLDHQGLMQQLSAQEGEVLYHTIEYARCSSLPREG